MGFWTLFEVASRPILQVLLITTLGAFLASGYCHLLDSTALKSMNKIVFMVFTPSLVFSSLAKTVTLQDIISWWFMPVNIGLTFLFGGILGWMLVKLMKPEKHLEGLIIAISSAGNLGNIMIIIVPAICYENASPFGKLDVCSSTGFSYASFSMAIGGIYIWSFTYYLIRTSAVAHKEWLDFESKSIEKVSQNSDLEVNHVESITTPLLDETNDQNGEQIISEFSSTEQNSRESSIAGKVEWSKVIGFFKRILEEFLAPPTLAAIVGLIFGASRWLREVFIGVDAPLRVIQDSIKVLGDGTIPCITLILGGNLIQGLRSRKIRAGVIIGVICVRYVMLPVMGIWVVKVANYAGLLPSDLLFHYVLMIQFTLPPAMNIGTMTQLFDVGSEECSILLMWTYLAAAFALTMWSTVYMWILS